MVLTPHAVAQTTREVHLPAGRGRRRAMALTAEIETNLLGLLTADLRPDARRISPRRGPRLASGEGEQLENLGVGVP